MSKDFRTNIEKTDELAYVERLYKTMKRRDDSGDTTHEDVRFALEGLAKASVLDSDAKNDEQIAKIALDDVYSTQFENELVD